MSMRSRQRRKGCAAGKQSGGIGYCFQSIFEVCLQGTYLLAGRSSGFTGEAAFAFGNSP